MQWFLLQDKTSELQTLLCFGKPNHGLSMPALCFKVGVTSNFLCSRNIIKNMSGMRDKGKTKTLKNLLKFIIQMDHVLKNK